ncbi:MAG: hypothetical protein ABI135_09540 [Rhodoferax sp.]
MKSQPLSEVKTPGCRTAVLQTWIAHWGTRMKYALKRCPAPFARAVLQYVVW